MASVFDKLNFKGQQEILVLNAPPSFEPELSQLAGVVVHRKVAAVKEVAFCLAFVTKQKEVDDLARAVAAKAKGDAIVWSYAVNKGRGQKNRQALAEAIAKHMKDEVFND